MGSYTIKDMERLSQVKAHTIRIWEKRYGLLAPDRSGANIRSYSDADLRKLLNISALSQGGMKISHIARLKEAELEQAVLGRIVTSTGPTHEVEALVVATMDMDGDAIERIISHAVLRQGFERTMRGTLIPFLERVGVLWQVGAVHPGQEHLVSLIVRQKVIAAIDGLAPRKRKHARSLILFLPEGEWHELGLLFAHFIARAAGHRVIYLGQSVPFKDLEAVAKVQRPDLLVTAILTGHGPAELHAWLVKLAGLSKRGRLVAHVNGAGLAPLPANVRLLSSLDDLSAELR